MATPETVQLFVLDQDANPIPGVLFRIFDITGTVFITQQYSTAIDDYAIAEVTLDGDTPPINYAVRLSKTGVAFDGSLGSESKTPQMLSIESPPSTPNEFSFVGETFSMPTASDPRLCRCSGFFKDISGRPLSGLEIKIINDFGPAIVDSYGVMGAGLSLTTDKFGYLAVDLYRHGKYSAMVEGVQVSDNNASSSLSLPRLIEVPDQGSANLLNLLFPVIEVVSFTRTTYTIGVNETLVLNPVVTASDGRILTGVGCEDVIYAVDDLSVAGISTSAMAVTVVGVTPGTTQLTAVCRDQTIVKIPSLGITGQPITIIVE